MRLVPSIMLGLLGTLTGCSALNPQRLDDQVAMFQDDLRWGRLPAASQFIPPRAVASFLRRHAPWQRTYRIMDVELEGIDMHGTVGTVHTRYLWSLPDEVEIRESVIETRWKSVEFGRWLCDDEKIISGDPALLPAPDPVVPAGTADAGTPARPADQTAK